MAKLMTPEEITAALEDRVIKVVAERTGLTQVTVWRMRKGETKTPKQSTIEILSNYLRQHCDTADNATLAPRKAARTRKRPLAGKSEDNQESQGFSVTGSKGTSTGGMSVTGSLPLPRNLDAGSQEA